MSAGPVSRVLAQVHIRLPYPLGKRLLFPLATFPGPHDPLKLCSNAV